MAVVVPLSPQVAIPSAGLLLVTLAALSIAAVTCASSPVACSTAAFVSPVLTLAFNQQIAAVITVTSVSIPTADQSQVTTLAAATYNSNTVASANQIGASSTGVVPAIVLGNLRSNQPSVALSNPAPFRSATGVSMVMSLSPQVAISRDRRARLDAARHTAAQCVTRLFSELERSGPVESVWAADGMHCRSYMVLQHHDAGFFCSSGQRSSQRATA